MTEKRFTGGQWRISVIGLDLVFKALLVIAEILFYQIMIPNGVCDVEWRDSIKNRLEMLLND